MRVTILDFTYQSWNWKACASGSLNYIFKRRKNEEVRREQDGEGVGGLGVHLSPRIPQEYTFRHRSACRTLAESGQEYLTSGKEYMLLLLSRFSRVWLCATPQMAAHQAPPSLGFSRQEHWSGLPFPSPMHESKKWKWGRSVVSKSSRPHGVQPTRLLHPWDFPGKSTGVGCHCLLRKNI